MEKRKTYEFTVIHDSTLPNGRRDLDGFLDLLKTMGAAGWQCVGRYSEHAFLMMKEITSEDECIDQNPFVYEGKK